MNKQIASIVLAGLAACLAMPSAQANLITNGGFETGDFSGWSQSGDTSTTGVADFAANTGSYGAFFANGISLGYLEQSFATVAGQSYTLDYWLANGVGGGAGSPSSFAVSVDAFATTLASFTNPSAFAYTEFTYSFAATGASTTLSFAFYQQPDAWGLDDVSVNANTAAVPEPGTLALLALGAAGMRMSRRGRNVA
jgi:hypothetical protein